MSARRSSVKRNHGGGTEWRTWIEIDSRAAKKNYETFRKIIGRKVKMWAVVKSNAYGHGLYAFAKLVNGFGIDGFCVDSLVEGVALRKNGIKKPILVLGHTLLSLYELAAKNNITISVTSFDALRTLARAARENGPKHVPEFHIKIDTGMHRQGFYLDDLPQAIKLLSSHDGVKTRLTGLFTHFAAAKDINYPTYTERQFAIFEKAARLFARAGFKNLTQHVSATAGTLINPKYHLDAVRIGIGLHGLWPSKELEAQMGHKVKLRPTLAWKTVVGEVKKLKAGDYVGYDLSERMPYDAKMAVLPVGYWHGLARALSGIGEVIVNGKRARILGKISMDITVVAPQGMARPGDEVTLIGRDGKGEVFAWEIAQKAGTTPYEFLTRLNPLIERVVL